MILYILDLLVPLHRIFLQQPLQQILQTRRQVVLLVFRLAAHNSLVDFVVVLIEMRREPDHQLVKQGAEAVDIGLSVVTLPEQDFGAHVLGRAAERVGSLPLWYDFRKSEIGYFNVAVDVDEYVLGLDVSVDNVVGVQVLEAEQQLRKIKLSLLLSEFLHLAQVEEHFAACAEVHYEKQFSLGLK